MSFGQLREYAQVKANRVDEYSLLCLLELSCLHVSDVYDIRGNLDHFHSDILQVLELIRDCGLLDDTFDSFGVIHI